MSKTLRLSFLHVRQTMSRTHSKFQFAFQSVPAQINRALKSSRLVQATRIQQPLDGRLTENRRPDYSRPDPSTHASLQNNFWSGGPDLNRQPSPWKSETLPLSYPRLVSQPISIQLSNSQEFAPRSALQKLFPLPGFQPRIVTLHINQLKRST